MLGRLLDGRYHIVRVLGSGGFGQTYLAEDTKRPGNPVCVLKHLNFSSHDPAILDQVRRMFFAEAVTLERLGRHDRIPQLLAYFVINDEEFYLVQEFIDGHPLSSELVAGQKLSQEQVITLLEDVLQILEFVHAQGVIHRDLKPENLIRRDRDQKLVLIDFGAVKTIETSIVETQPIQPVSVPIYTSGYAASEQCLGKPKFNSDIYSLGVIAIQALTGVRPSQIDHDPNTGELAWRSEAIAGKQATVSDDLAIVLDTMTKFHFSQRYQTAKQVTDALAQVKSSIFTQAPRSKVDVFRAAPTQLKPRKPIKLIAAGLGAIALVSVSAWAVLHQSAKPPTPMGSSNAAESPLSLGEMLISPIPSTPVKQAGIDQIKAGNFLAAVRLLELARRIDKSDPETLIYLNNARIGQAQAYTIAVVVPLRTQPPQSLEVLRGVAQAQDQLNRGNGIKLKVAIASDNANSDLARRIAQQLVDNPTVLGVIGHGTSDTTYAAGEIYQTGELVAISPVSSAKDLSGFSRFMFRTMPSDEFPAKKLAAHMVTQLKKRKAVIFFNSANRYSRSLKDSFKDALYYGDKGEVVSEIDFNDPSFEAASSLTQAMKKGAEVIFLAPNSEFSDRALLVINANQKRLPILAGDALYTPRILNEIGDRAAGMVVAVPSIQTQLENSLFERQAKSVWGKPVEWRSALGYDATQAFITALQKAPTRNGVRAALSTPEFSAIGAVGSIKFASGGDRDTAIALMSVTATRAGGYEFKPYTPQVSKAKTAK